MRAPTLRAHAAELLDRCEWAVHGVRRARCPELLPQCDTAIEELERLAVRLRALCDSPLRDAAELAVGLTELRAVGRELDQHSARLVFLLRARRSDLRLGRFVKHLCAEVRWPLTPPLVACVSAAGWSTDPDLGLIYLPVGEDRRLLGLPDLLHELGHALYVDRAERLVGNFLTVVADHVDTLPSGAPYPAKFPDLVYRGWGGWLAEFTCDLVATYAIGPSFGWQNLRLAATMSHQIYQPVPPTAPQSHPADAARMEAILAMLTLTVGDPQAATLRRAWHSMLATSPDAKPVAYESTYPPALIDELARRVHEGCRASGIHSFADADHWSFVSTRWLIDRAWRRFREHPDGFERWQRQQIRLCSTALWLKQRYRQMRSR